jgi:hypothetical protein
MKQFETGVLTITNGDQIYVLISTVTDTWDETEQAWPDCPICDSEMDRVVHFGVYIGEDEYRPYCSVRCAKLNGTRYRVKITR